MSRVKTEKGNQDEDKEISDWAKKLFSKPVPQTGVQTSTVGLAPIFTQGQPDPIPPNLG